MIIINLTRKNDSFQPYYLTHKCVCVCVRDFLN